MFANAAASSDAFEIEASKLAASQDALKAYSTTGDVPALKGFATELVPIVTAHLNMAKGL